MLVLSVCLFLFSWEQQFINCALINVNKNRKSAFLDLDFEVIDVQTYPVDFWSWAVATKSSCESVSFSFLFMWLVLYFFLFFRNFKIFKLPQFWPLQPKCWLFLSCCLHNFFYCFRLSEIYELWCFWPLHYKFSFYLSIRFWLLYLLFVFTFPFISNFWIITFWPLDLPSYRHIVLWPLIERSKNNMFIAWEVKRSKKEVKTINCKNAHNMAEH